jgi:Fe-S cluster biogenesis protein NfuA
MAETTWKDKVPAVLETVRPMLQRDGGDVELIEVTDDGIVKVALRGHCHGCPMSQMTLKMGIEFELKKQIPEVKQVVSV